MQIDNRMQSSNLSIPIETSNLSNRSDMANSCDENLQVTLIHVVRDFKVKESKHKFITYADF